MEIIIPAKAAPWSHRSLIHCEAFYTRWFYISFTISYPFLTHLSNGEGRVPSDAPGAPEFTWTSRAGSFSRPLEPGGKELSNGEKVT